MEKLPGWNERGWNPNEIGHYRKKSLGYVKVVG
jgi:hypothetical protein